MEKTNSSSVTESNTGNNTTCNRQKKGRRPRYTVLDLSTGVEKKDGLHQADGSEGCDEKSAPQDETHDDGKSEENKGDVDDIWDEEVEFEEDTEADERKSWKEDKNQEYNLFVKSHQKRTHCTTKKSKRPRSNSE